MKVVINRRNGGFMLSNAALLEYAKRRFGTVFCYKYASDNDAYNRITEDQFIEAKWYEVSFCTGTDYGESIAFGSDSDYSDWLMAYLDSEIETRSDPLLISIIEEFGVVANGKGAYLKIVEIPDDLTASQLYIDEYEGDESVHERHRSWR